MLNSSYGMWQNPQPGGDGSSNLVNTHTIWYQTPSFIPSYTDCIHTGIDNQFAHSMNQDNLWSELPMSKQPSRMYRGFRMAAVPDADRIQTSSLRWGGEIKRERKGMNNQIYWPTVLIHTVQTMFILFTDAMCSSYKSHNTLSSIVRGLDMNPESWIFCPFSLH